MKNKFKQGDNLISIGLDMDCRYVITNCIVFNENVIINEGIKIKVYSWEDYLTDTKENRKILLEKIKLKESKNEKISK